MTEFAIAEVPGTTFRLIPSQFPPIATFDVVATAGDLEVVMELEGWTNDRLVLERLSRLPRNQWIFGIPNASIVMASFLHVSPDGMRFNTGELGAWYAAMAVSTAAAEVAHHLRREAVFRGKREIRRKYRSYSATLHGAYVDLRGPDERYREALDPGSYAASQSLGESVRAGNHAGIIYDSVRHSGGTCVVAYWPRNVRDVTVGAHYEVTAPVKGRIVVRMLNRS